MLGILTKTNGFFSSNDEAHDVIIEENPSLKTLDCMIPCGILRFEINPPNDDMTRPLDEWSFHVDQDILPEWYSDDPGKCETRARKVLVKWAKAKLFINRDAGNITGQAYLYGNARAVLRGNARAVLRDNASADLRDNAVAIKWSAAVAVTRNAIFQEMDQAG
jgi:hypothetical protein